MNVPVNRPPLSMPKAAINTLIYLYLVFGSVPALFLTVLGPATGSPKDLLNAHFSAYVAIVGGWLLGLLFIVRSGRVVGLYLFRGTAFALATILAVGVIAAVLLASGIVGDGSRDARLTGQFGIVGFVICLPLLWLLMRGLSRIRWLNLTSTPDEWEPPARQKDVFLKTMTKRRPDD